MAERTKSLQQEALKIRKRVKKSKPDFVRSESWRYVKLKESWRKPRGLDHKMRRKIKGWPPTVSTGYKGPKAARGLHPSGYREVLVYNAKEVSKVDPRFEAARIAHTVSKRKRTEIIAEAKRCKVFILNFPTVEETIEAETEEEIKEGAEEKPEKPAAEEKKAVEKEKKPKRSSIDRKRNSEKEKKTLVKKSEKPKASSKKAKAEKGVEEQ